MLSTQFDQELPEDHEADQVYQQFVELYKEMSVADLQAELRARQTVDKLCPLRDLRKRVTDNISAGGLALER